MKTHDLIQGSQAWHDYRANHFNASDAPAMLGISPYKTRSELLHELATGQTPEIDPATQRRFDDGHRFEALARPLAEKLIGKDLYPVTGSEGRLSASFDGLTAVEDTAFEHKTLNESLRYTPWDEGNGLHLPVHYQAQMEQQLLVSGAERVLFMASKWKGDELVEERHCWYVSEPKLRAHIVSGWEQFAKDLEAYVPPVVTVDPVAKTVGSLPVVFDMRVQGKLVSCNLEDYKPAALAYIEKINTKLVSDQDFVDADADAKFCRDSADRLELAIEQALGQMGDINQALNTVREIAAAFDAKGLALEKLVKAEKENRRNAIVSEAAAEFVAHMKGLNERLGQPFMPAIATDFPGAVKGLKILSSMKDKVATELARAKIEANAMADRIQSNIQKLVDVGDKLTFPDAATLVLKAPDDLAAVIALRVAEADRKAEELRESVRKEEAEKLAAKPAPLVAPAVPDVTHEAVVNLMPATVRKAIAAPAPAATSEPTLKLGEIGERLGFNLTADFLKVLGFEPAKVDRASKLFHEEDFPAICQALMVHIGEVSDQFNAVAA